MTRSRLARLTPKQRKEFLRFLNALQGRRPRRRRNF